MRYLSLCSGIEAASVAWHPLGWQAVAFAEIEPFPCAVLAHHYPDVPNLGDISAIDGRRYRGTTELIIGGTPCQDFSIAGKRAGLDGERSGLVREFMRLLSEVRPQWFIWENVPGVLSSGGGADFREILNAFDDCGYSCAWRVLDAQFFGVPQRRRRVFVIGHIGDWRSVAKVLFEQESICRHFAKGGKERKGFARSVAGSSEKCGDSIKSHWEGGPHPCLAHSAKSSGGIGRSKQEIFSQKGAGLVPYPMRTVQTSSNGRGIAENITHTLDGANGQAVLAYAPPIVEQAMSCKWSKGSSGPAGDEPHNLIAFHGSQDPDISGDITHPLGTNGGQECCIAFQPNKVVGTLYGSGAGTQRTSGQPCESDMLVLAKQQERTTMRVRRLTPRECERLQGFPDDYTNIIFRGKPATDSPRYKALGNSMAVPVIRWLGKRIQQAEENRSPAEAGQEII